MNCHEADELLLEADPVELRGASQTSLAVHLRSCDRCAARAARILDTQERLAAHLAARGPTTAADRALERASATARRRQSRRRLAWRATPLLAAAIIAGVLITTREPSFAGTSLPEHPPGRVTPTIAQTPSDQNVVVYQTDNPDIVVVWLY